MTNGDSTEVKGLKAEVAALREKRLEDIEAALKLLHERIDRCHKRIDEVKAVREMDADDLVRFNERWKMVATVLGALWSLAVAAIGYLFFGGE